MLDTKFTLCVEMHADKNCLFKKKLQFMQGHSDGNKVSSISSTAGVRQTSFWISLTRHRFCFLTESRNSVILICFKQLLLN